MKNAELCQAMIKTLMASVDVLKTNDLIGPAEQKMLDDIFYRLDQRHEAIEDGDTANHMFSDRCFKRATEGYLKIID